MALTYQDTKTKTDAFLEGKFSESKTSLARETDALYLPQDFTSSNGLNRKGSKSPRQIISSYSPSEKQFVTFTLAPVDVDCVFRCNSQGRMELTSLGYPTVQNETMNTKTTPE
ncbi:predicted protein [Arabidopsis lyrata subsp. lyrata]|uniref:Predicted protein n=1 Tax=Arabidopsis lyrata subsp. lyrata TaxID=81972 RepID=D7MAY9_ARALL|nr:predicted protein [Arabidopsis lyrata subsp. lyrata]